MLSSYEAHALYVAGRTVVALAAPSVAPAVDRVALDARATWKLPAVEGADDAGTSEVLSVLAAGSLAEALAGCTSSRQSRADLGESVKLATAVANCAGTEAAARVLQRAVAGAEFHLRLRWAAVERVAALLVSCQTMTSEQARDFVQMAPERPRFAEAEDALGLLRRAAGSALVTSEMLARFEAGLRQSAEAVGERVLSALEAYEARAWKH